MDWLLAKDNLLVRECCIHIVPMIDLDGVENGDQGKNRFPTIITGTILTNRFMP